MYTYFLRLLLHNYTFTDVTCPRYMQKRDTNPEVPPIRNFTLFGTVFWLPILTKLIKLVEYRVYINRAIITRIII